MFSGQRERQAMCPVVTDWTVNNFFGTADPSVVSGPVKEDVYVTGN